VVPAVGVKGQKGNVFARVARALRLSGTAVLGVRLDDNSQFGSEATPRVAAGLTFDRTRTSLTVSWAQSFNAPSLTDLYYPGFSNPSLKPELSTTKEFRLSQELFGPEGLERLLDNLADLVESISREERGESPALQRSEVVPRKLRLTLDASYFMTDYSDLIFYDYAFGIPNNIARAEIDGLEAGLTANYGTALGGRFQYTNLDARRWNSPSSASGPLYRRPRYLYNLSLWAEPFERLKASVVMNTSSSVPDNFDFLGADGVLRLGDREGYTKVDLALSYALSERYKLHIKLDNLLDREYEEVKGFPAPGRNVLAGVTLRI
jgi:vitamin B12 transporter